MASVEHEVRGLADMQRLEAAYGHFPEVFLLHHSVEVRVRGVDKVANAARMYSFLWRQADRFGWVVINLGHLADLAAVADALVFVRDELLPFHYAYPKDQDLLRMTRDAGFLVRELGTAVQDRTVKGKTDTIGHRMTFTAQHAWDWETERVRSRIVAHAGEISNLLERQVTFP